MSAAGFVRCEKLTTQQVGAAGRHGRGDDARAKARRAEALRVAGGAPDQGHFRAVGWQYGWEKARRWQPGDKAVNYGTALRKWAEANGAAKPPDGKAAAMHLLIGVGDQWAVGNTERRNALVREAVRFVERELKAGVVAWRMDLDERGQPVVDIIATAAFPDKRRKDGLHILSPHKCLEGLRKRYGAKQSYEALQDAWAEHAKEYLDADIVRGEAKRLTQREHEDTDRFKAKKDAAIARERERLKEREAAMAAREAAVVAREAVAEEKLDRAERTQRAFRVELSKGIELVGKQWAAAQVASPRSSLPRWYEELEMLASD